jgi:hypothetical protein
MSNEPLRGVVVHPRARKRLVDLLGKVVATGHGARLAVAAH